MRPNKKLGHSNEVSEAKTGDKVAVLAVLASCGVVCAGAGADKKEAPKPLPPEIVDFLRIPIAVDCSFP